MKFQKGHKINLGRGNSKEDVWERIDKKSDIECWPYIGTLTGKGYGQISIKLKRYRSHRLVYEEIYGDIPEGMLVCHSCNNPSCCNPNHLYLDTPKGNSDYMVKQKRQSIGEDRPLHKLTMNQAVKIRELFLTGNYSKNELGRMFNVSQKTIINIVQNKIWKD